MVKVDESLYLWELAYDYYFDGKRHLEQSLDLLNIAQKFWIGVWFKN
jgi:hypothetical protein